MLQAFDNDGTDEPRETRSSRGRDRDYHRNPRDYDNRGGKRNYGMDRDEDYHSRDGDYYSRDGSPTMEHTNHMGIDPDNGSIGTGV